MRGFKSETNGSVKPAKVVMDFPVSIFFYIDTLIKHKLCY